MDRLTVWYSLIDGLICWLVDQLILVFSKLLRSNISNTKKNQFSSRKADVVTFNIMLRSLLCAGKRDEAWSSDDGHPSWESEIVFIIVG